MYTYVGCSADYERCFSLQPHPAGPVPCETDQLDLLRLIATIPTSRGPHRAAWLSTPWSMIWKFFRALNWGKLMFWKSYFPCFRNYCPSFLNVLCLENCCFIYFINFDLFLKEEKIPIATDFIFYWILITEVLFK